MTQKRAREEPEKRRQHSGVILVLASNCWLGLVWLVWLELELLAEVVHYEERWGLGSQILCTGGG